jgi:zinc finger SWIM domain-containing protein 3
MTSTQRSEGMNNVFKKRFRRKLGLSELLVEYEKVSASLRENEVNADFHSCRKIPITYSPNLPILKSSADSYTRRMFSEFEEEFKDQFLLTGRLLQTEGSILTYIITHMQSDHGATVVFNTEDMTTTCSCRKYESIGMYTDFGL